MAITVQLTDDTTTFDLVYDASSQPYYHSRKGLTVQTEETAVLQHRPDSSEPVPIRGVDMERTMFLTADILGATEDEVLDKVAAIKRMVDGADQQALRYHTHGDVDRVKVKMKRSSATNYTYQIVKYGHVDDSGAHYTAAAQNSGYAIGILVTLHLTAYGEGEAITLRNDLASSPHFIEANTSATLADGWNDQGTPTRSIASTIYLIGGKSQRVETDSSTTEGISSDTVAAGSGVNFVAYVWVYVQSGNTVTVQIRNGAATVLASKTVTTAGGANYDKSAPAQGSAAGGGMFYRLSFASTTINTNGVQLYIIRAYGDASAATVFFVDGAYVQLNTTTIPNAWCSTSAIKNRYDPTSSNEDRINYVDVWGVPGDSDALVKTAVTLGSVSRTTIIASRHTDGEILAANIDHWIESNELTTASSSGTWTSQIDANRSNGTYKRFTEGGSPGSNSRAYILLTGSDARAFLKYPRRFFAIARASSTTSQYVGVCGVAGDLNLTGNTKTTDVGAAVTNTATWELIDLGLISGEGVLPASPPSDSDQEVSLNIYVQSAPSSSTNDIDAMFLPVPGDEFVVWVGKEDTKASGGQIIFDGTTRSVISEGSGINEQPTGGLWNATANKMNRYIFAVVGSDNAHTLTDTMSVSFTVYPRTRHLLGTS